MSDESVTITVKIGEEKRYANVGEQIFLSKRTMNLLGKKLFKKHFFVARLKKKKYRPSFIITSTFSPSNEIETMTLKPFNF